MPSYPKPNQFADLEEMMCKQLLSLDLREPIRPPPSLSLAMRTPGYTGQLRNKNSLPFSSLSCLPTDPSESAFMTSSQWGQQSESPMPPQRPTSSMWGKSGFLAQRSVSMVETGSGTAADLNWPGNDISLSALNTGSSSSLSSSSSASSSSRYKTELCRSFTESGLCKYGAKCQFAHGHDELRDLNRHPKYKTELCRTFHTIGFCPYGIRCHFVHNSEEEEKKQSYSRSSSSSSCSSWSAQQQPQRSSRPHRPPLVRHSFSFAGFPSALQQPVTPLPSSFTPAPTASPPPCADITDFLSNTFLDLDSAFEASPAHKYQALGGQTTSADPRSPFLPSPDSGCCGLSPTDSPSPGLSPGAVGIFPQALGARSTSYTSLSDQDQDGGSSASSLSGSDANDAKRLAVFSQLSVPDDTAGVCL